MVDPTQRVRPRNDDIHPMRAELLLETSGLTRHEQLMVKTACPKPSFEGYSETLLEHHEKNHLKDSRSLAPPSRPFPVKGAGKNKAGGWYRSGYFAGDYDCQAGDEAAGDGDNYEWNEDYGEGAYVGYGGEPTTDDPDDCDWVSDEDLGITLTAMAACDVDETSTDGLEELGEACQHQLQAYAAVERAKGKGPYKGSGKGKNKNKGKGKRVVKTQLSIQDRKVRLASLKKNSRCLRCGGYGHWAGDPECKIPNKKANATTPTPGQTPNQRKVGYFALSDSSGDDNPLPCMVIGAGSSKKKCGYMGYRTPIAYPAKAKARTPPRSSPATSDGSFTQVITFACAQGACLSCQEGRSHG